MKNTFEKALEFVLEKKGCFIDNFEYFNGNTYMGINRLSHPDWMGWYIIDQCKKEVHCSSLSSTLDEDLILHNLVYNFYYEKYWKEIFADTMPASLAIVVFDCAVTHGCNRSFKFIQESINTIYGEKIIDIDGIFRNDSRIELKKILAKNERYVKILIAEILRIRVEYCETIFCTDTYIKKCYRIRIAHLKKFIKNLFHHELSHRIIDPRHLLNAHDHK